MTARPLRLAVVTPFGEVGGAELYLTRILDATDRLDVHVALLRDGPLRGELEARGIAVSVLEVGRRGRDLVRANTQLASWLRRTDPDVVLSNGVKAAAAVAPAAWLRGDPHLWIKHDHSYDGALTQVLGRLADVVVVGCDELVESARGLDPLVLTPPMPAREMLAVPDARSRLEALAGPWSGRTLAMLTRLAPYKGVDVAVHAMSLVAHTDWRLVVLGAEDPAAPGETVRLERLAESLGVAERVRFVGFEPDAARLLPAVDALAMLTRSLGHGTPAREAFGLAAAEAMTCGVPVIAADDGGESAGRLAGGAGLLVDPADPASVARALLALDDETSRAMSRRARQVAATFVSAEEAAERLLEMLTRLAHRPGAGLSGDRPVSVVVPVLDEARVIHDVLEPLTAQLGSQDELLVVDSGSRDDTRNLVRAAAAADPRVRLVEVEACSISGSRNHGVAAASHDLIACTDAGCCVDQDWLESIRSAFSERREPGLLVGVYRARVAGAFQASMAGVAFPDPHDLRRSPVLRRAWLRTLGPRLTAERGDGRSLAFTRAAFASAGGFRDELQTAEDEAFVRDVIAAGTASELLVDAAVTWVQRPTAALAFRQFRGYGRGAATGGSPGQLRTDAVRAGGYALLATAVLSGPSGRLLAVLGVSVALAFPAGRVLRRRGPVSALLLLPVAQVVKDVGKLTGVLEARLLDRHAPMRRPS